jgi:hypothetical protein
MDSIDNNVLEIINLEQIIVGENEDITPINEYKFQVIVNPGEIYNFIPIMTNTNGDCMVHALLLDESINFRKLKWKDKEIVAKIYRKTKFLQIVLTYFITPKDDQLLRVLKNINNNQILGEINIDANIEARRIYLQDIINSDAPGYNYLPDEFLNAISKHYKFNIFLYSDSSLIARLIGDRDLTDDRCIMIFHSGGNHYSGMYVHQELFTITRLKAEQISIKLLNNYTESITDIIGFQIITMQQLENMNVYDGDQTKLTQIIKNFRRGNYRQIDRQIDDRRSVSAEEIEKINKAVGLYKENRPRFQINQRSRVDFTEDLGLFNDRPKEVITSISYKPSAAEDITKIELQKLKIYSMQTLQKLKIYQEIFGNDIPKKCIFEKVNPSKNIKSGDKKEIQIIEEKLEAKLSSMTSKSLKKINAILNSKVPVLGDEDVVAHVVIDDNELGEAEKNDLIKNIVEKLVADNLLCDLAHEELVINQAEKFKKAVISKLLTDGTPIENYSTLEFAEDTWKIFLKKLSLTSAQATIFKDLDKGTNKIKALRIAAGNRNDKDFESVLLDFKKYKIGNTLYEFLNTYKLSGFPIQTAFDFDSEYISDDFAIVGPVPVVPVPVVPVPVVPAPAPEHLETLNGKEYIKSMIENMSLPLTFELPVEFAGSELRETKETDGTDEFYVTKKMKLLNEDAPVYFSKNLTVAVEIFEKYIKTKTQEMKKATLLKDVPVSIPIYIIFTCLARQKNPKKEYSKIWQQLIDDQQLTGDVPTPETPGYFINISKDSTPKYVWSEHAQIPEKVKYTWVNPDTPGPDPNAHANTDILKKNDGFIYNSYHAAIIFICDGLVYTLGYGYDADCESNNKYLDKIERSLKQFMGSTRLFGTGFLYSPDSLDIGEITYNYKIIDIGILKKCHINRINKNFTRIKQLQVDVMVQDDIQVDLHGDIVSAVDIPIKNITIDRYGAETYNIYSRLASKYLLKLPGKSLIMNCSSFIESIFYDRIDCDYVFGVASVPNYCKKKGKKKVGHDGDEQDDDEQDDDNYDETAQEILTSYYGVKKNLFEFLVSVQYEEIKTLTDQIQQIMIDVAKPVEKTLKIATGNAIRLLNKLGIFDNCSSSSSGSGCNLMGGSNTEIKSRSIRKKIQKKRKNKTLRKPPNPTI